MNNILRHKHYRFYQSDYDEQGNSILDVARDPWGIGVTYAGYALLFVALVAILIERRRASPAVTWSWIGVLVVMLVFLFIRMRTHTLLPVLRSPFFSLHISTIVTAYALLLGIMVVGIIALFKPKDKARLERLKSLSTAMLYPAVALLAIGIFIGAVWANISWGNYWSWDPKEVWALITLLIYAAPLHEKLWKTFQRPLFFHIYGILAVLSVVITYFGVNLLLGGVHAY
jgi:ABC-type transport system involved in cytochrome c biogenesis permease subunit